MNNRTAALLWALGLHRPTVYGDARWMNRRERRRTFTDTNEGLVLSPTLRTTWEDAFANLVIVAPTGIGKSSTFVIPNVLNARGSVVVTDPSGEVFKETAGFMKRRGYRIKVFRPSDMHHSDFFNPLLRTKPGKEVRQLSMTLGEQLPGFWGERGANLLYVCLAALKHAGSGFAHIGGGRWLLNHITDPTNSTVKRFMRNHLTDPQLFSDYVAFMTTPPKELNAYRSTALSFLSLWADREVCCVTTQDNMPIERLRDEPIIFYLTVPINEVPYYGLLFNLFCSACFNHCIRHTDGLPVTFLLDEFGNLGKIRDFSAMATTLRKSRCSLSIILQSKTQLEEHYGPHGARIIFEGGCSNKLFLAGLDLETTKYIESMLGQRTAKDTDPDSEHEGRLVGVPLMRADTIRMLKRDEAILISRNYRPLKFKTAFHYQQRDWRRWSKISPPSLELAPVIEPVYLDLGGDTNAGTPANVG